MTKDPKARLKEAQAEIDLGLGGLLGDLGAALSEVLSRLDTEDGGEVHHEKTFQTPRGPIRASAGIRVRPLGGSSARSEGRRPETPVNRPARSGPDPAPPPRAATADPASIPRPISATILGSGATWTLVADLPGVSLEQVTLTQEGAELVIVATGRGRAFAGRFDLPAPLTREALSMTMQNGILEITAAPPEMSP